MGRALLWASGCAALGGQDRTVTSNELFLGLLLAHPDPRGEMWQFLDHFGLTARDLLADDYRVIDGAALHEAAAAARGPDPTDLDVEVVSILTDASVRAGGQAQVLHVMAELLTRTPWQERLQSGLTRFGISAENLVRQFNDVVPSLDSADSASVNNAAEKINLRSSTPAGEQIGQWLSRQFPRRPATMASFSNDVPDPGADFIGVSEEADAFAYLIGSRTLVPPLAIGLFGHWGSGKSFLMAKIRQRVSQLTTLAASDGDSASKEIWTKVVPIEFNAWQYVETDLWAALLSRIFDALSPEARRKLTELSRQHQEANAQRDEILCEQMRAESAVADLVEKEKAEAHEAQAAAEQVEHVKRQIATLQHVAQRTALDAHARSSATTVLVTGLGSVLGPRVVETLEEARRLKVAAEAPAWRQSKFWSWNRLVWVSLAVLVVPTLVVLLDLRGFALPTALTAALGTCAALLVPVLGAAAAFVEGQQKAALDAEQKVREELSNLVKQAEQTLTTKERAVEATRGKIEVEQQKATQAAAKRGDLDRMAARLNAGTVYADFLSGRYTSDDYRKRLGIVTTVSDDLETLSSLVAEYNSSPEAQQPDGPPNRIVLYIDDLDRCPPARVVEVLEAVHLLLAFPLFVVVVAVDTRWLTAALSRALPILKQEAVPGISAPTATDYIEKIFQIPFWVEPLDEGGRHRLLRGLLLPSVAQSNSDRAPQAGTALHVGRREQEAADTMLAVHGPRLDLDAQNFTITAAELEFVAALNPLVAGTPRQVKRFVNICKLLLAMSPPLAGGNGLATERTAACFMAAVHQSMPSFAKRLAAAAASPGPGATLEKLLLDLVDSELADDRKRVQDWLARLPAVIPPARPFGSADALMLIKRWDVLRRLRFAEDESNERAAPAPADEAS
ncbi:P-loop NTPase fold protein [Nonomuraea sp. NPDC049480]|uniref:P-loop NTPase fold protein n=1 Tax=Nonomuraea sp. NPDC049480 TaxID=3364353 RepID=UPI0037A195D9